MGSIVVAMPRTEDAKRISEIIRRSGISQEVITCTQGAEILRLVQSRDVGIVVCVAKYKDMGYQEIASYLPIHIQMILLSSNPGLVVTSGNIMKLMMPFKGIDLSDAIRTLMPSDYYHRKKKKVRSPEEQKVLDEAKAVLMEKNGLSEPEAFRYLQKNSMDTGRTLMETAQMILMLNGT